MTDFGLATLCSTSGQTCSSSAVVRPEFNKFNGLTQVEVEHVRPPVQPLFVLKMYLKSASYGETRTNNRNPYIIYMEADLSVPPPYIKIISLRGVHLTSFPGPIAGGE